MGSWNEFLVPAIPPEKNQTYQRRENDSVDKSSTRIKRLLLPELYNSEGQMMDEEGILQKDEIIKNTKNISQNEGNEFLVPAIPPEKNQRRGGSIDKSSTRIKRLLLPELYNSGEMMMDEVGWIIFQKDEIIKTYESIKNKEGNAIGGEEKLTALYRKKIKSKGPAGFTLVTSNVYPSCDCKGLKTGCMTQRCTCIYFGQECREGCSCIPSCPNMSLTRKKNKKLRIGTSEIHGLGCFSMEDIIKGEYVAEYTGEIVSRVQATNVKNPSKFLFETGDKDYLLDGSRFGSELAKMNHRRGKEANCEFRLKRVPGEWRAGVWALEDITVDDELFVDYGDDYRGHGLVTPYIKKACLG